MSNDVKKAISKGIVILTHSAVSSTTELSNKLSKIKELGIENIIFDVSNIDNLNDRKDFTLLSKGMSLGYDLFPVYVGIKSDVFDRSLRSLIEKSTYDSIEEAIKSYNL